MYDLNPYDLKFEGLKSARVIFGKDNKVLAVLTVMTKDRYHKLLDMLSSKYKLISQKSTFVGDKEAEFEDGDIKILLVAPHLSFELTLTYIHKDFYELYMEKSSQDSQKKANQEMDKI